MNLPLSLLGLLATMLAQTAASPIAEPPEQTAGCTVTIGACPNGSLIELNLTECACKCLESSCSEIGGCDNPNGTPFKGDDLGNEFQNCVQSTKCLPIFAAGQELNPSLINCAP
ncbi:hypothetical protein SAPIO_CDS4422 [Scedosporium apiospermum]|uniref:Extracellular membrane protein CFEM domain-containing protein n=1 Tax=Pseudallescheria apiosperma TaxID=563466 RepID=A0A084G858_PSEDA|nr:uncharacterized protein SAPIO_CDS4422 [Scedosporium apiospermum]KEZ43520.1 hypothetical protein SAPIO_CDS4422 [Scedosporium apiospermum]